MFIFHPCRSIDFLHLQQRVQLLLAFIHRRRVPDLQPSPKPSQSSVSRAFHGGLQFSQVGARMVCICNPPQHGSAPTHRAGREPGIPAREAGALIQSDLQLHSLKSAITTTQKLGLRNKLIHFIYQGFIKLFKSD